MPSVDWSGCSTTGNHNHSLDIAFPTIRYQRYEKLEEDDVMETLYHVIVVDQLKQILVDEKVVAKSQEGARYAAGVYKLNVNPDDLTIIVKAIDSVKVKNDK